MLTNSILFSLVHTDISNMICANNFKQLYFVLCEPDVNINFFSETSNIGDYLNGITHIELGFYQPTIPDIKKEKSS